MDKTRTFELIYTTSNSPYVVQMDCSVISRDLCEKIERIYQDFGKYLHRYACSNAQTLIDKFQNALQVFENRPIIIEDFAKYATYLIPHKLELSSNQQTIEYFSSLFDVNSFVFVFGFDRLVFFFLEDHLSTFRSSTSGKCQRTNGEIVDGYVEILSEEIVRCRGFRCTTNVDYQRTSSRYFRSKIILLNRTFSSFVCLCRNIFVKPNYYSINRLAEFFSIPIKIQWKSSNN